MKTPFTQREWVGLAAGICFGVVLGHFFGSEDKTGLWLTILLGPPVVLLISPDRPLLSWQLPVVTAAIARTFMNPATDDSGVGALAEAALVWFTGSLLSLPWAVVFHYRFLRFRQLGTTPKIPIAYVGMVLLVSVCCGLTLFGLGSTMVSNDPDGRMSPIYGVLIATGGIALSLVTEQLARKLEIQKLVRGVFEICMIPGAAFLAAFVVAGIVSPFLKFPGDASLDETVVCIILVSAEQLAAMIWLTRLDRRERSREMKAQAAKVESTT